MEHNGRPPHVDDDDDDGHQCVISLVDVVCVIFLSTLALRIVAHCTRTPGISVQGAVIHQILVDPRAREVNSVIDATFSVRNFNFVSGCLIELRGLRAVVSYDGTPISETDIALRVPLWPMQRTDQPLRLHSEHFTLPSELAARH